MKIYRNENINLNFSQRSRFPRVSREIIDKLWLNKRGKGGQEFLELALNLIGDYEFDKKYIKELDEYTFELKTTEGKTVRVELECGNMDDCPQIKVTEDNVQMSYDYTPISGYSYLVYFDTTMKKELDTGFIQFYDGVYDNVQMRNNGVVTNVIFYNPNPPASYDERQSTTFLVSDELKDVVKQLNPSDFVNLYNEIAANLDENINSFEIHSYDGKTRKTLNRVIIINKKLAYILLTKKYNNGSVTLEEDHRENNRFTAVIDNVDIDYNDTLYEFSSIKGNMERKLI